MPQRPRRRRSASGGASWLGSDLARPRPGMPLTVAVCARCRGQDTASAQLHSDRIGVGRRHSHCPRVVIVDNITSVRGEPICDKSGCGGDRWVTHIGDRGRRRMGHAPRSPAGPASGRRCSAINVVRSGGRERAAGISTRAPMSVARSLWCCRRVHSAKTIASASSSTGPAHVSVVISLTSSTAVLAAARPLALRR